MMMRPFRVLTPAEAQILLHEYAARRLREPLQFVDHHRSLSAVERLKRISGAAVDNDNDGPKDVA